MNRERFAALLRQGGMKATRTRLAVLEVLDSAASPLSAKAVLAELERRRGPADRVTVYRALEAFYRAGFLERVQAGDRERRYHLAKGRDHTRHPHFHCSSCGALSCLPPEALSLDLERLARVFPAQVDHLQVSLEGVCPECLAKGEL